MPEWEQRWDTHAVVVAVADVETFAVDNLEILAGPVVIRRGVLEAARKCALCID